MAKNNATMLEQNKSHESSFPSGLSQPAQRALAAAGYQRLEQLTSVTEAELGKLHGIGPKVLGQLRSALSEQGLSFAGD